MDTSDSLDHITGDSTLFVAGERLNDREVSWQKKYQDKLFEISFEDRASVDHFVDIAYLLLSATVWDSWSRQVFGVDDGDTAYYELTQAEIVTFTRAILRAGILPPSSWPRIEGKMPGGDDGMAL